MKTPKRRQWTPKGKQWVKAEMPMPPADPGDAGNFCFAAICEPALLIAAQEAVKFLDTAHEELRGIRSRLFRENLGYSESRANERLTLEGLVRRLSAESACLVGELRTIAEKLG